MRYLPVLLICLGTGLAAAPVDPMQALTQPRPLIASAVPMTALRAPEKAEGDGPAPNPEFGGLPDAPGAEETFYQCTACHSTEIIKQQRVTDARWDDLWVWMVEHQGMIEPEPETRAVEHIPACACGCVPRCSGGDVGRGAACGVRRSRHGEAGEDHADDHVVRGARWCAGVVHEAVRNAPAAVRAG